MINQNLEHVDFDSNLDGGATTRSENTLRLRNRDIVRRNSASDNTFEDAELELQRARRIRAQRNRETTAYTA